MTRKQATQIWMGTLEPEFAKLGWKPMKSSPEFRSEPAADGSQLRRVVYFTTQNVPDGIQFRPQAALRVDWIEDLVGEVLGMEKQLIPLQLTVGRNLDALAGKPDHFRIRIQEATSPQDLSAAKNLVLEGFHSVAEPFFERFGTIEALDEEFNGNPARFSDICGLEYLRAIKGVLIADRLGRADVPRLIALHREAVRAASPAYEAFLDRFLAQWQPTSQSLVH